MKVVRVLRLLLITLAVLVSLLFTALFVVVVWPQTVVNKTTFQWASQYLKKYQGIELTWKSVDIRVSSPTFLRKSFGFDFEILCINAPLVKWKGCTPQTNLGFEVDFSGFLPKLIAVGPVEIRELDWTWVQESDQGPHELNEEVKVIHGNTSLLAKEGQMGESGILPQKMEFEIWGFAGLPDHSRVRLQSVVTVNHPQDQELSADYQLEAHYTREKAQVTLIAQGNGSARGLTGRLSGDASGWVDQLPQVSFKDCDFSVKQRIQGQRKELPIGGAMTLNCPLVVQIPLPPDQRKRFQLPTEVGLVVKADLQSDSFIPSGDSHFTGGVEVRAKPVLTPLARGEGHLMATVDLVPSEPVESWNISADVRFDLAIDRFQKFAYLMNETTWVVPAPLHVLHGSAKFRLTGKADLISGHFPFTLVTRLGSAGQSLELDGTGKAEFKRKKGDFSAFLDLDMLLTQVKLELPRLDWAAPPPLFPDGRFQKVSQRAAIKKAAQSAAPFKYRLFVHTPKDQPIQILSNLSKAAIPIHLNIVQTDSQPLRGEVSVGEFPVEFFRRKAQMKKFVLKFKDPLKESSIDGSVGVVYADYTIHIRLLNTLDKPIVHFTSDPPLQEDQLVAVLLFGQPMSSLDSGEGESVGNTNSAIKDGALGLFSLYALASTPVQSVGYDPTTGTVSAKVKLAQGTSLNLGKGVDNNSSTVGVRKRLGGPWTVSTGVSRMSDGSNIASAYLEWRKRY